MSTTGFWIDAMCHCTATSLADVKDRFREPPPKAAVLRASRHFGRGPDLWPGCVQGRRPLEQNIPSRCGPIGEQSGRDIALRSYRGGQNRRLHPGRGPNDQRRRQKGALLQPIA